jgi:hypothetical protein
MTGAAVVKPLQGHDGWVRSVVLPMGGKSSPQVMTGPFESGIP